RIITVTYMNAPLERVYDSCRSIDIHLESAKDTGEKAVAGRTSGLIGLGETVTWQGRHFGLWLEHTSQIIAMTPGEHFRVRMVKGMFRHFVHDYFFHPEGDRVKVVDILYFSSPLGQLGELANRLFLTGYLRKFLRKRLDTVKLAAEGAL